LVVPYDAKSFGTASSNGQMIFDVAPKSKAAEELTRLAQLRA
jgi:pilus assembly protein CpaE